MTRFLRSSFWTVHLAFLLLASLLLARLAGLLLVQEPPPAPVPARAGAARAGEGRTPLDGERLAALLGLAPAREEGARGVGEGLPRSPLALRLLGTLVSARDPSGSLAAVQDLATRRVLTLRVGAPLAGAAVVLAIERTRLVVRVGERREFVDGAVCPPDGGGCAVERPSFPPPPGGPSLPAASGPDLRVRPLGAHAYAVPREALTAALGRMEDLATQARLVPAFRDGVARGFKVFSVRPGSVYAQLGVESGDVVRGINGLELSSPERALEAYALLRGARTLDIELERHGAPLTKRVRVE
jgi:general secretion pathway protein C